MKERMVQIQDAQKDSELTSEVSERELELEAQLVEARSIIQEQVIILFLELQVREISLLYHALIVFLVDCTIQFVF